MSVTYTFAPYQLLPDSRALLADGAPVKLGGRAFDTLLALVERRHRVVSKRELMELVWPRLVVEDNNLQVQVASLRKLLGHPAIATVPGCGYRFTLPVAVQGDAGAQGQRATAAPPLTPAVAASAAPRHNLPPWLPRLYGREADLRELGDALSRHTLVTVVGPGGIGKTRLAQAAVARLADQPAGVLPPHDGLWWVDLAPLADPKRMADAMALAAGLRPQAGADAMATLLAAWADAAPLVVLDNAEHLLDGVAALLDRLRQGAPRVRWLVTSQEVLRVADECVMRLGPLELPHEAGVSDAVPSGAVALFAARAEAADRHFVLRPENEALVADICRQLDGNPLAIELAAARVPLLGIQGLRERLDQRLNVLTSGERSAARRHHTLRAALEWSHQLLAPAEQAVLRRLGVCAAGFSLQAAQQLAEDDAGIDRWDVLEHLGSLVDKSLVVADGPGDENAQVTATPRYRLLETTRLFALERLIEHGEAERARERHREHYLAVAEAALPQMVAGDPRGLAALDLERDNLFLALAWPQEDERLHGLRLAAAMRYYWTSRGLLARGLQSMLEALARPAATAHSALRCTVLASTAQLCSWLGDHADALAHVQQALHEARGLMEAAQEQAGAVRTLSLCLSAAGFIHLARDESSEALATSVEGLALARTVGDGHELGNALGLRSAVHRLQGEHEQSRALQEEAVALRERLNQPWSEAVGRLNLAHMAIDAGQPGGALPQLLRVLALLPRVDSQHIALHLLGSTAEWAAVCGEHEAALILDAACARQHASAGMARRPDAQRDDRLDRARQALPAEARDAALACGAALSLPAAVLHLREFLRAQAEPAVAA